MEVENYEYKYYDVMVGLDQYGKEVYKKFKIKIFKNSKINFSKNKITPIYSIDSDYHIIH